MTLRSLVKRMDRGYYHEGILLSIYDNPKQDSGDGLATFIVQEVKDIAGKKRGLTHEDVHRIRQGLYKAMGEVNDIIGSF